MNAGGRKTPSPPPYLTKSKNMDSQKIVSEIRTSSFFVIAALSPSFLISLVCVLLYLVTAFPEIKEPLSNAITNLLKRAGVNVKSEDETVD